MLLPTLDHETIYWQQGVTFIAGLDEAGMGALAGPVVAGAVIISAEVVSSMQQVVRKNKKRLQIRDSKTLSVTQREELAILIKNNVQAWAVGEASVEEITTLNIRRAAHLAMRRAVEALSVAPELLLIDGNPAQPHPTIPAINIIKGDALSISIAAASILAKVHRDALMVKLDAAFPVYGFAGHKGYGSAAHLEALAAHGPCACHRPTYAPVAAAQRPLVAAT